MNIIISEEARMHIRDKGSEVTVGFKKQISGGWCAGAGRVYTPSIQTGKPSNEEAYDKYEVDGISVYVSSSAKSKVDKAVIGLRKFLGSKKLYVKGIDAYMGR